MFELRTKIDLNDSIDEIRVSDAGDLFGRFKGRRTRLPAWKSRPRKELRERLKRRAIEYAESNTHKSNQILQADLKTELTREYWLATGNKNTDFVDPVTMFWIIRICLLIVQFIAEKRAAAIDLPTYRVVAISQELHELADRSKAEYLRFYSKLKA